MTIAGILSDPCYANLKKALIEETGLHYYDDKDDDLGARLARRMTVRGARDCEDYLNMLAEDAERDSLIGELTIGETYFFRQPEHFKLLRAHIIPDLLNRRAATRSLRIWSSGCATGAEPYSISLLLQREFPGDLQGWDISILATDINVDFLAKARAARFASWALRDVDDNWKRCCFESDDRTWVLRPEYRRAVTFQYHNLASSDPYPAREHFDIIFCRNVLIYFSLDRIREVVARLYQSLAPGGWLLVGHAEPRPDVFSQFELVIDQEATGYRKQPDGGDTPPAGEWPVWNLPPAPGLTLSFTARLPAESNTRAPVIAKAIPVAGSIEQARALADAGQFEPASAMCSRLIQTNPLDAAAHFTKGLILAHHGDTQEAQSALRRAIYLDRRFTLAHYHLGILLQSAGRNVDARKTFRNVIDLLKPLADDDVVRHSDGLRAEELRELAAMHLESMDGL